MCFCFDFFHVVVLLLLAKAATTKNRHFIYELSMLCLGLANNQLSGVILHGEISLSFEKPGYHNKTFVLQLFKIFEIFYSPIGLKD
jgi:hypothetical protein